MPRPRSPERPRPAFVHLVRHAETLWNEQGRMQGGHDSPLTSAGRYRTTLLAADFHEVPLEAAYAAPGCAADTARILVAGRGIAVGMRSDLREMDLGPWEGRLQEDVARDEPERYQAFWQRPERYSPKGGESFAAARERMRTCMDGLIRAHRGGAILVVSHAAALQLLLASVEGRAVEGLWKAPELRPCSHSVLRATGIEQARIVRYAGLPWPPRTVKTGERRTATMPA